MNADYFWRCGLTTEEVENRKLRGLVNNTSVKSSKTIGQIIFGNIFTLFNGVNFIIFILILITGKYLNTMFMGVIVANTLIGIVQEIRAKKALDKLKVITTLKARVIRNCVEESISVEDLVIDDACILETGDQVSCDGVVLNSNEMEVDESLLTGESEPLFKKNNDKILSGSFVVAGKGVIKIENVGSDNYAQKLTIEAKKYKRARSEILYILNKIIKGISYVIFPVGILLFASQYFRTVVTWQDAVVSSATGIIGMIPEGLVLLTTIAFAVGVVKLAMRRTVIQELAGIEVLARVNVLCLDKTGTLTKGTLEVEDIVPFLDCNKEDVNISISEILYALKDNNSTSHALSNYFKEQSNWKAIHMMPFSSSRKWSGVTFENNGTYIIGAPEFIIKDPNSKEVISANEYAQKGYRVILLAHSKEPLEKDILPNHLVPMALILLIDTIRSEAKDALKYFSDNGVDIKIISGDNPSTVSAVGQKLNLKNADKYIDASTLANDVEEISKAVDTYTIFGRVSPYQKRLIVGDLKAKGNIVAMTGDGVNDVLALRDADCSIAMASGSDASKNVSHIVLLDSDFTVLPTVVLEGRKIINNIERVASLFLVKTTFSVILSLLFIFIGASYPFFPVHQTLIGAACIGIPAFLLSMEKNGERVEPGFLRKVMLTALPGGIAVAINIMIVLLLQKIWYFDVGELRLISVIVTAATGFIVLYGISKPLNIFRTTILCVMITLFFGVILFFHTVLELPSMDQRSLIVVSVLSLLTYPLICSLKWMIQRWQTSFLDLGHKR